MTRSSIRAVSVLLTASLGFGLAGFVAPATANDTGDDASSSTEVTIPTRDTMGLNKAVSSRSRTAIMAARAHAPESYPAYFRSARYAKWYAEKHIKAKYGWGKKDFKCLKILWQRESSWRMRASGAGGKYLGIPQIDRKTVKNSGLSIALFRATPELQIHLGTKYIKKRDGYGNPCKALAHKKRKGWY